VKEERASVMHPFSYTRANEPQAAIAAVQSPGSEFIAGGTDMLQLLKAGQRTPRRLIDINALPLANIDVDSSGARIGALARMSDVADDPGIVENFPAISQALLLSASAQLRNMASIGGNLLQRTRCTYFRDASFAACNKRRPASGCAAIGGENRMHAILGGSDACVATHPSDLAVALVALDAVVHLQGPEGGRSVPIEQFHALPGDTPHIENVLRPGELIVAVDVPAAVHARRSHYLKIRDRTSYEFALTSAAVGLDIVGDRVRGARVAMGGIGTKPWRLRAVEEALLGTWLGDTTAWKAAADKVTAGAHPLEKNAFKIELAKRTVLRALETVAKA
jgi:xanthine dehydrogenase YagS FAD-binding subunit